MLTSRPGVPKSEGMTTVNPASTRRRAKPTTPGWIPGASCTTTTAGPEPARNTRCVVPSCVKADSVKPLSASAGMALSTSARSDLRGADLVEGAVGRLGQPRDDEEGRRQRGQPAERDGAAQAAHDVVEVRGQQEARG